MRTTVFSGSIIDEQIKLELDAVREGVQAYQKVRREVESRGDAAMLKPCQRLLAHWFEVLRDVIDLEQKKIQAGGRYVPSWAPMLMAVDADRIAVCAMHEAVGACVEQPQGVAKAWLAGKIGAAIAAEFHADVLSGHASGSKSLKYSRRLRRPSDLNDLARRILDDTKFGLAVRYGCGGAVLELMVKFCSTRDYGDPRGIEKAFEEKRVRFKRHVKTMIVLSDDAQALIEDGHGQRQGMRPRYLPMIVPPYPWTADAEGGYVKVRTPLVIGLSKAQRKAMDAADLTETMAAVNALSATPWRINRRVLDVVKDLWDRGGGAVDIPPAQNRPVPPSPGGTNLQALARWKREAATIHTENAGLRGQRRQFLNRLGVAVRFVDRDAIYFPHQLDYRGRAYPVPQGLNHQQGDLSRGLLEFAEPRALGGEGEYWVRVHLAGCFGIDKVSYDDRVRWTHENIDHASLQRLGENPLDEPSWQRAEKPWQALAAMLALSDPLAAMHLPVQIDGTCNGIQHLAALSRDAQAGGLVNLVPGDKPSDLYAAVAEVVRTRVEELIADGSEVAPYALRWVTRKIIKRVPMTKAYGVTPMGAKDQIQEELEAAKVPRDQARMIAIFLAPLVLEAVDQVCPGPAAVMDWFRACAETVVRAGHKLRWTVDGGWTAVQNYTNNGRMEIKTLAGRRLYIINPSAERSISLRRQRNGSSPNVVHSLDARHLRATALRCRDSGITFAGVHDSFWTHAADVPALAAIGREEFVRLHRQPILEGLQAQWEALCGKEMPAPPTAGTLDLQAVSGSLYFFS